MRPVMFSCMRGACSIAKFTVYEYAVDRKEIFRNIYSNLAEKYSYSLTEHINTSISVSMQETNQQTRAQRTMIVLFKTHKSLKTIYCIDQNSKSLHQYWSKSFYFGPVRLRLLTKSLQECYNFNQIPQKITDEVKTYQNRCFFLKKVLCI